MERQDMQWGYRHLKKWHMKIRKNQTFQRPSLCYFNLMYFGLCCILYIILHSHSWIAPHYRERANQEHWPLARKETLSLSHHCSPCHTAQILQKGITWVSLWVFWQDSKHCRSFQILKDNEQEVSSVAFKYLLLKNIHSIERCKDII